MRATNSMGGQKCKDMYTREQRKVWVARNVRTCIHASNEQCIEREREVDVCIIDQNNIDYNIGYNINIDKL